MSDFERIHRLVNAYNPSPASVEMQDVAGEQSGRSIKPQSSTSCSAIGRAVAGAFSVIGDAFRSFFRSSKSRQGGIKNPDLASLYTSSYVRGGAISCYAEHHGIKGLRVTSSGVHSFGSLQLPERQVGDKLIAIPVVIRGGFFGVDHIVTFVYDVEADTVEYFDSKGKGIDERTGAKTIQGESLAGIKQRILDTYSRSKRFVENRVKQQFDIHNCGVYVLDFIHRRAGEESLEDIQKDPLIFERANRERRDEFIEMLDSSAQPVISGAYEDQDEDDF